MIIFPPFVSTHAIMRSYAHTVRETEAFDMSSRNDTPQPLPPCMLFDMDNTLYDFFHAKNKACTRVTELAGVGEGAELFRYFLNGTHGFEHHHNIRDYLRDRDVFTEKLYLEACTVYDEEKVASLRLYPGVDETIRALRSKGVKLAIVTDAESPQAEIRMRAIGLRQYFDTVVTPDISGKRKPNPDTFLTALENLGETPDVGWVVGDSPKREIEPGNALGMKTIYAQYGDWIGIPYPQIVPHYTIQAFSEIKTIFGLE